MTTANGKQQALGQVGTVTDLGPGTLIHFTQPLRNVRHFENGIKIFLQLVSLYPVHLGPHGVYRDVTRSLYVSQFHSNIGEGWMYFFVYGLSIVPF